MHPRLVIHQLGVLFLGLAGAMGVVAALDAAGLLGVGPGEREAVPALLAGVISAALLGGGLWVATRGAERAAFNRKDALLLVACLWLLGAALAATPYYAWSLLGGPPPPGPVAGTPFAADKAAPHAFTSFAGCYFEAMSGLSTTGATVLGAAPNDIESLPRGLLLWRALTHWLGGLGIVVLFVAVIPVAGMGGKKLFELEAPSPTNTAVRARVEETARVLWMLYAGLTLAQVGALRLAGMPWFDAVCHSLSVLATGGLSTRNASLGAYYNQPAIDAITIVFMLLAALNFGLYYRLLHGRFRAVWTDPELRVFLGVLGVATLVIAFWIWGDPVMLTTGVVVPQESFGGALRDSLFQVVAIQTGTGFSTVDYEQWPFGPKAVLVALMFFGGMAGSTTGGLKVVRLMILFKILRAELERKFRPRVVQPIRIGGNVIAPEIVRSVPIYIVMLLLVLVVASVGIKLLEPADSLTYGSAMSAAISTLMNVGPGVAAVGATDNYGFFGAPSLLVLSLLMALGRLELFAILVLFSPRFWRER